MDAETKLALAHALRTPLTSLALGLGLLDGGALGALTEAQREVVRILVEDVARLSLLVGHGLSTERLGAHAGPVERVAADLDALVAGALDPLAAQAEERAVSILREPSPGLVAVVDPVKLRWAVATLVGNAVRYSPRGGRVRVRVARRGDAAEIAVSDEGPGIAPALLGGLFSRGGGLGLFLVREIVEAHGGDIRAESEAGEGATLTIRLPADRTAP